MTLGIEAMPGGVAARIDVGSDTAMRRLSPNDQQWLRDAFMRHSVLLVRGETFDDASLLSLTRVLGEPDIHPVESIRLPDRPEIIEIVHTPQTRPAEGPPGGPHEIVGELGWHADLMYTPCPSLGALLWALEVPERGGETAFIDTARAYEALDDSIKRELVDRNAVYRFEGNLFRARSRDVDDEQFSEVHHPLVLDLPGAHALNVSPAAIRIEGLEAAESEQLLGLLNRHLIQDRFMYVHRWQPGDLVLFNNMRTLHRALGHERRFRRILHRTTLKGQTAAALPR